LEELSSRPVSYYQKVHHVLEELSSSYFVLPEVGSDALRNCRVVARIIVDAAAAGSWMGSWMGSYIVHEGR
jgi:hypothetical protein